MTNPVIDSSSWTGLPSHVRAAKYPYGDFMTEADDHAMYREYVREDRRQRLGALAMLWGPPIIDNRSTGYRTDGVIAYQRKRDEEWTLWRGIVATFSIIFNRTHGRREEVMAKRWTGSRYVRSFDLGFWESRSDGYGYSAMILWLYPGGRVSIFSDGESFM